MSQDLQIYTYITKLNEANMYLIKDSESRHAILVDPSDAETASAWIDEEQLQVDYMLLTHEHYDHIAAINDLRQRYSSQVIASVPCSERIQNPTRNLSKLFNVVLVFKKEKFPDREVYAGDVPPYEAEAADITFTGEMELKWRGHRIHMWEAPGHSKGSILIAIDGKLLFSGDTLSYEYELILRLPGGSKKDYREIAKPLLESFPEDMTVYPGHGRSFELKEGLQRAEI